MKHFLTLVASSIPLTSALIAQAYDYLESQSIKFDEEWYVLSPERAIDISLTAPLRKAQIDALRDRLPKMDVFLSENHNRQKKLFIADMDSTIVSTETLDELADLAGVGEQVSSITQKSMRGEINFEQSLTERVALIEGITAEQMQETLHATKLNPGATYAVQNMRKTDTYCVLVSGGFTYYTKAIAERAGFNDHYGNVLDIVDNKLTGKLAAPILGPDSKLEIMQNLCEERKLLPIDVIAVGDGANDRFMLEAAGLGVGYHPKPLLQDILINQIRYTDLTSLLYIQGYKDQDFIKLENIIDV